MLYKVSEKELLSIRNSILIDAIPILTDQGFVKEPFATSWFGRNNLGDYSYEFARLSDSFLELLTIHICRGDKWIQAYLNIINLNPIPDDISELKRVNGLSFHLPPDNMTESRLDIELPERRFIDYIFPKNEYRLRSFSTCSGFVKRQKELDHILKHDFKNIDKKIELWHKIHTPINTNWEGIPMSLNETSD